ncbi:MAG: DUF3445 domain-containing protein [Pseudomonadota bacterium]
MQPLDAEAWLQRDACFTDQMAYRDRLIARSETDSVGVLEGAEDGVAELASLVLKHLSNDPGYRIERRGITRPCGRSLRREAEPTMAFLGRLVQEDLLLLRREEEEQEHRLIAGVLCFPSHWTLSEKLGRPLTSIHEPVPFYAGNLAKRVQRLFDGLRMDRPLWRANWLLYPDAELHAPRRENAPKREESAAPTWLRVERQTLLRLPRTGDVVFSIKTDLCPVASLSAEEQAGLRAAFDELDPAQHAYKGGAALRAGLEPAA